MGEPDHNATSSVSTFEIVLADYLRRLDRGEKVDQEAFVAAHPDDAGALRSYFAAADAIERMGLPTPGVEAESKQTVDTARGTGALETAAPSSSADAAAAKSAADSGPAGRMFGRYRIGRILGRGAMGTVYLAEDTQLRRQVAIKIPHFEGEEVGESLERFYREARAAATLRHSNICPVHDVGEIDGKHFISMAYIEGRSLAELIKQETRQSDRQILIAVRKLAQALQDAHDHGIVHRDLKPANIMVDKKGEPLIMDFGLARHTRHDGDIRITRSGALVGTPAYMSPEQVEGDYDKVGSASDQYSLGVILYEMLTGQLPFRGSIALVLGQIVTKAPTPPSQSRLDLDPRIEAVCLKMMAKISSDRFASLNAVADELAAILRNPAPKAIAVTPEATANTGGRPSATKPGASQPLKPATTRKLTSSNVTSMAELARKCWARHDYEQVVQIIEQVPEDRRSEALRTLLEKARDCADEVAFLGSEIDDALRRRDKQLARRKADELLKIQPGHLRAQKVQEELAARGTEGGAFGGWKAWGALACGVAGLALLLFGVTLFFRSGKTVVKVEINSPDVEVTMKGSTLWLKGPGTEDVQVVPGDQELTITCAGLETTTKSFTIKKGETKAVTVSIVNSQLVARLENEIAPLTPAHEEKTSIPIAGGKESLSPLTPAHEPAKANAPQLLVAPFDEATAKKGQEAWASHLKTPVQLTNSIGMKLALIPSGEFMMGSTLEQIETLVRLYPEFRAEWAGAEQPQHRVRISRPFYLGAHEVTRGEFAVFVRETNYKTEAERDNWRNAGFPQTDEHPVVNVSWNDAVAFCDWLSRKERRTYRLATEAEWEYACRAGTTTLFSSGDDPKSLVEVANLGGMDDGHRFTAPVGSLRANAFGLHDMHGNVWEMCADWFAADYYARSPETDPTGPSNGSQRVERGQTWDGGGPDVRSAHRDIIPPEERLGSVGFRIALLIGGAEPAATSTRPASRHF